MIWGLTYFVQFILSQRCVPAGEIALIQFAVFNHWAVTLINYQATSYFRQVCIFKKYDMH